METERKLLKIFKKECVNREKEWNQEKKTLERERDSLKSENRKLKSEVHDVGCKSSLSEDMQVLNISNGFIGSSVKDLQWHPIDAHNGV